jgi:thioredoxin reductase
MPAPPLPDGELPVAVIGGGPVGLAAAAHLIGRGLPVRVYEAGETVGASVRDWGHVRTFSPWRYNIDEAARKLLKASQWSEPPPDAMPSGAEIYEAYLRPLAAAPEMAAAVETGARVAFVTRQGMDKVTSRGRAERPFLIHVDTQDGGRRRDLARAVVDASGTWTNPNPLGGNGLPADGEAAHAARIAYGIPDVLGRDRETYAGRRVLVVGAGHSAADVLIALVKLAGTNPATSVLWAVRGHDLKRVYGGGEEDQLPARAELGALVKGLVEHASVTQIAGFSATSVDEANGGLVVEGDTPGGTRRIGPVDRIVVATGQRPDLAITRELRLELDPWLESARALGPLIDPNEHSCGSVPPHGHRELSHPEPGFYTVGIKSYGRAPTFLLLTGYEQVRSVVAAIAGDIAAADRLELVLPETGVCSGPAPEACCGGPAADTASCCRADEAAKAAGAQGCGCASPVPAAAGAACCARA